MPRAINLPTGTAGVASHTLSPTEEWTLGQGSVLFDMTTANDDDACFLEARTPDNSVIYRQFLYFVHFTTFVSFATGAEPWDASDQGSVGWPQQDFGNGEMVTERVSPVTLGPGCTLYMYANLGDADPTVDPLTTPDTGVVVRDGLLWVQDTNPVSGGLADSPNPILLGVGA